MLIEIDEGWKPYRRPCPDSSARVRTGKASLFPFLLSHSGWIPKTLWELGLRVKRDYLLELNSNNVVFTRSASK